MHQPISQCQAKNEGYARAADQVVEYGRAVQGELRPDDPRLRNTVQLACRDGTNLLLPHAFTQSAGDWIYVFTKDHGYFVEHKDAVAKCSSTQAPSYAR